MGSWIYQSRLCREERAQARAVERKAAGERQMRALEYLAKTVSDPRKLFSAAPWSFKKSRGFRLSAKSRYAPHQGEREKTRRMRQMGACWA